MASNLDHWKTLQSAGYFETHPFYQGLKDVGRDEAVAAIGQFLLLREDMKVVVIGCGYGRESLGLAARVKHVFGIDVSDTILDKARGYLAEHGVQNFTPVLAEEFKARVPAGIHGVFSIVVMQHLTRNLVREYFSHLASKLVVGGFFVVQFIEELGSAAPENEDVDLSVAHEPSVTWTSRQIWELAQFAGLEFVEVRTIQAAPTSLWHWAYLRRPG